MFKYFDRYRVRRDLSQQEMMLKLQIRNGGIFKDYSSVMMVSGMVGYANGTSRPIITFGEPVQLSFFSERDRMLMDLMAYASSGGNQTIVNEEEKYKIFEEYVAGGFPILCRLLEVDNETEFDERTRQRVLKRYYSLTLRKNGFVEKR